VRTLIALLLLIAAPPAWADFPETASESSLGIRPQKLLYPEGDIRRYGASEAVTDNSAAINAALKVSGSGGASAYIPAGTWNVAQSLYPFRDSSIHGEGANSVLKVADVPAFVFLAAPVYSGTQAANRQFRDIAIINANQTDSANVAITINFSVPSGSRVTGVVFSNLYIAGWNTAFFLRGAWNCDFIGNKLYNNHVGFDFLGQNIKNSLISNHIINGSMTGTGESIGVWTQSTEGESTQSLHLLANYVYYYAYSLKADLVFELVCEANDFSASTHYGIYIATTMGGVTIDGGWVESLSGGYGVYVAALRTRNYGDIRIRNVHIRLDNAIAGSRGVFIGAGQWGVTVEDCLVEGFDQGITNDAAAAVTIQQNRIDCLTSVYSRSSYALQINSLSDRNVVGPNAIIYGNTNAGSAFLQAALMSRSSARITVSAVANYPIGTPIMFDASANGFSAEQTYWVVGSSGTSIEVAATIGGPALEATGSAPLNVYAAPLPLTFNVAGTPPHLVYTQADMRGRTRVSDRTSYAVVFAIPLPSADYYVQLAAGEPALDPWVGEKTRYGFQVHAARPATQGVDWSVGY
jgi:hypothetical protein